MYELALFAGGGGGCLATQHLLGWHTLGYVEFADYPVAALKQRIKDGYLHDAPIWGDIRTFRADNPDCGEYISALAEVEGLCITAGFPCQPFSAAGKRRAADDPRNTWPDTARVIGEIRPDYVFLENVPALLWSKHGYFGQVLGDLAACGYDARWDCIPACAIGANHQRDRLWVVANAKRDGWESRRPECQGQQWGASPIGASGPVADAKHQRRERIPAQLEQARGRRLERSNWWETEPGLGRVADGMARRVDRLKAIGNGQVPAVVASAWHLLTPIRG